LGELRFRYGGIDCPRALQDVVAQRPRQRSVSFRLEAQQSPTVRAGKSCRLRVRVACNPPCTARG
jgi:hypothetical protein